MDYVGPDLMTALRGNLDTAQRGQLGKDRELLTSGS